MNEAKFTPGPWKVGVSVDTRFGAPWPVFRLAEMGDTNPDGEEVQAVAQLMEVAPEMYEKSAFKRNVLIRDNPDFEGEWVAVPREDFDALRAVLAKARGES